LNGQIGKTPEIMNANLCQEHIAPKGITRGPSGLHGHRTGTVLSILEWHE
jgi:hypothetical protein